MWGSSAPSSRRCSRLKAAPSPLPSSAAWELASVAPSSSSSWRRRSSAAAARPCGMRPRAGRSWSSTPLVPVRLRAGPCQGRFHTCFRVPSRSAHPPAASSAAVGAPGCPLPSSWAPARHHRPTARPPPRRAFCAGCEVAWILCSQCNQMLCIRKCLRVGAACIRRQCTGGALHPCDTRADGAPQNRTVAWKPWTCGLFRCPVPEPPVQPPPINPLLCHILALFALPGCTRGVPSVPESGPGGLPAPGTPPPPLLPCPHGALAAEAAPPPARELCKWIPRKTHL